ncbi:hypothetical protein GC194_09140 [bacterium]|nr:hypothetical protein [bacterium]
MTNELVQYIAELVQKDFYFDELTNLLPQHEQEAMQALKNQLAQRIAYMIDHDFELLMQVFYRIDLNEQKVKEALALSPNPSEKLADLVIEREIQKAQTRMKYRSR